MNARAFLALSTALLCGAAAAEPFDIKGIRVDTPADCQYIRSLETRSGTFFQACESRRESWMTEVRFLDRKAALFTHQSSDGTVLMVTVSYFDFAGALDALTVKFGPPMVEHSKVQNRMGASFDQTVASWQQDGQTLVLSRHGVKVGEPSLKLIGRGFEQASAAERAQKAVRAASQI